MAKKIKKEEHIDTDKMETSEVVYKEPKKNLVPRCPTCNANGTISDGKCHNCGRGITDSEIIWKEKIIN